MPRKPPTRLELFEIGVKLKNHPVVYKDGEWDHENMPGYGLVEYLYVVKCNDFIKIGASKLVEQRIKRIQTCCPYEIELLKVYSCKKDEGYPLERFLHSRLREYQERGEWFKEDAIKWL